MNKKITNKYNKLKKYWNIKKPTTLKHPKKWNGITITPTHNNNKKIDNKKRYKKEEKRGV